MPTNDRFGWSPGQATISQCAGCVHKRPGFHCAAFPGPDEIPDAILANRHDHREPFDGDHGVRFESRDDQSSFRRVIKRFGLRIFPPKAEKESE